MTQPLQLLMLVILMHNPSAGGEDHRAGDLVAAIERAGHRVTRVVSRKRELAEALRSAADLVAVAGGDGTVNKAAEVLTGSGVPLTVLALGTANNLARTLRLDGPVDERIAAWGEDEVAGFDVGRATAGRRAAPFFEAAGFGAFPRLMRREAGSTPPDDPARRLARDLKLLRKHVGAAPLRRYEVEVDGRDASGDYLMVEVLNIPFIGAQVALAPAASPGDGLLDVVLVGEAERDALRRAIERLADGGDGAVALPTRRAARVEIRAGARRLHLDGELCKGRAGRLSVRVDRAALRVLAPRR